MKKYILILIGGMMLSSFSLFKHKSFHKGSNEGTSAAGYNAAVKVSQGDFDQLTGAYGGANTNGTLGGMVGKNELKAMIASMPSSDDYVNFRFATDPVTNMVSVMFMGGKSWYQSSTKIDCLRNGGTPKAFCPPNCSFESGENPTVDITYAEYNLLSSEYQLANPGKSWGGNIDKDALTELINSIADSSPNVAFMFCTDPSILKTSVIFIGGTVNQEGNAILYMRNGVTSEAFCPPNCSVRE